MADQFFMSFRSIDGLLSNTILPSLIKIGLGNNNTQPSFDEDAFNEWQCGNWLQDTGAAYTQWTSYYSPCALPFPNIGSASQLSNYLISNNYNSEQDACNLAVFKLLNENGEILINKQLALRAFVYPNDTTIRYFLATREEFNGVWTYTTKSPISPMTVADTVATVRIACGVYDTDVHEADNLGYGFGLIGYSDSGHRYGGYLLMGNSRTLATVIEGTPDGEETSEAFGPGSEPGGYGPGSGSAGGSGGPAPTFDGTSDPWVETPTKPGVLSFGLLNVYKCDQGALSNLGAELFPEITWPPTTGFSDLIEWLGKTIQAFSDSVWNKGLIDYIVSVHLLPVEVQGGSLEDIKIGPRTMTGILARPISSDVIEIDCGAVHVDEYYTNYVDYMTQCRVYIPYYGMVSIKPEYWQSADIRLKYLWNVMDGSFIAKLYSTITRHQKPCTAMIGQYSGSACVHMPLSGANYSNMFSQLAGGLGGAAAGIASGNVAMAATSAMNYAGAIGGMGNMEQSNAYNASSAFYGHSRPYLIIERPVSHFSTKYVDECGLPVLVTKKIGACSGLTICENPVLNFACPDDEAEAIKNALREGVIL